MSANRKILIGCLAALGCELLYGFSYLFTKNATGTASVLALLGWRFLLAFIAICICAAVGVMKIRLRGRSLKPLIIVALFSPIAYFFGETYGITLTTTSESGTFLACIPVVSVIASTIILKEKPTKRQIAGILITLAGVIVTMLAVGGTASFSLPGYLLLSISVVSCALYSVFVEKAAGYSSSEITFMMVAGGAAVFASAAVIEALVQGTFFSLVALPFTDTGFLTAILYQGLGCSICAFFLSNVAISMIGVNRTSTFVGVSTAVSIIAGIVFLNEAYSIYQLIGAVIILAGVYIANMGRKAG